MFQVHLIPTLFISNCKYVNIVNMKKPGNITYPVNDFISKSFHHYFLIKIFNENVVLI